MVKNYVGKGERHGSLWYGLLLIVPGQIIVTIKHIEKVQELYNGYVNLCLYYILLHAFVDEFFLNDIRSKVCGIQREPIK